MGKKADRKKGEGEEWGERDGYNLERMTDDRDKTRRH